MHMTLSDQYIKGTFQNNTCYFRVVWADGMPSFEQKWSLYRLIEGRCGPTVCPLRAKESPLNTA